MDDGWIYIFCSPFLFFLVIHIYFFSIDIFFAIYFPPIFHFPSCGYLVFYYEASRHPILTSLNPSTLERKTSLLNMILIYFLLLLLLLLSYFIYSWCSGCFYFIMFSYGSTGLWDMVQLVYIYYYSPPQSLPCSVLVFSLHITCHSPSPPLFYIYIFYFISLYMIAGLFSMPYDIVLFFPLYIFAFCILHFNVSTLLYCAPFCWCWLSLYVLYFNYIYEYISYSIANNSL